MKPVRLSPLLLLLALAIPLHGEDAPPPPPPADAQPPTSVVVVPVAVPAQPPTPVAGPNEARPAPAADAKPAAAPAADAKPVVVADGARPAADATPAPAPIPPPIILPDGRFVMEFRGVRLGQALDYLSKAAGYVIANAVDLPTPITLVAKQPLTASEAVEALNGVLLDQGFAIIVRGKTLRVVTLASAKQQNLPVEMGSDPAGVPETDRMVTQIIPVRCATAKDLAENLQPLLNTASATMTANESSNSLILTDTQANIHRIVSIVHAIDTSIISEQQVKVFHLRYADADKVARVVNDIYGSNSSSGSGGRSGRNNQNQNQFLPPFMQQQNQGGGRNGASGSQARGGDVSAAADSGTNSLVLRAGTGTMEALAVVVKELDVDTTAKDGVLLYRVRNGKSATIAKSLNSLFQSTQGTTGSAATTGTNRTGTTQNRQTTQGAAVAARTNAGDSALDLSGQVRVVSDDASNSVLVLSSERNFERLQKVLTDLDQPMRQVLIRVLVAEVTIERGMQLGVQMEALNITSTAGAVPGAASSPAQSRVFSDFNMFDQTLGMNGFILNSSNFRAAIRALATDSRFDVLSRPYVLTTDNQKAIVNVSQNVPMITGTRTDQNNNITSTFTREDVGIILTVTPQINSDGRVLLDVDQELTALTDQTVPVAKDVTSPIIKKRSMTTRVAVDHGQTVVVGGLVHDTMAETVRKVPGLGDIPYLGALFRYTSQTKAQTELLVFLTPQVVKDPSELSDLGIQLRNEMSRLDAAVEQGTLQHHLDQLMELKVGDAIAAPPANPGKVVAEPAKAKTKAETKAETKVKAK